MKRERAEKGVSLVAQVWSLHGIMKYVAQGTPRGWTRSLASDFSEQPNALTRNLEPRTTRDTHMDDEYMASNYTLLYVEIIYTHRYISTSY